MLNSDQQRDFGLKKCNLSQICNKCKWVDLCNGGCPKYRELNYTNKNITLFCNSFKMFMEHTILRFQKIIRDYKNSSSKKMFTYDATKDFIIH